MSADTLSPRRSKPAAEAAEPSNEFNETLRAAGSSANHLTGAWLGMYSDNLAAVLSSGTETARLAGEFSRSLLDLYAGQAQSLATVGRETLTCRTPDDVLKLQSQAITDMTATLETASKLYAGLFAACSKAVEPLTTRAADAPERMFRAVAD